MRDYDYNYLIFGFIIHLWKRVASLAHLLVNSNQKAANEKVKQFLFTFYSAYVCMYKMLRLVLDLKSS